MSLDPSRQNLSQPRVSVVIPVFNGGADLEQCLQAVFASSYPVYECILVDDASTDGMTAVAAERHAVRVISFDRQGGPAVARNRGAEEASGDILFFTDADVVISPDALAVAVHAFHTYAELSAVFGSYDDQPGHAAFLSQYRNLFHHWVHQTSGNDASTFWTGCGAIYRHVFIEINGFNEDYERPSIEDIELGARLCKSGHLIRLEKTMLVKHMKHWRFWNMIKTDIFDRGVPWMKLVLHDRNVTGDLNLSRRSRIATLLAGFLVLLAMVLPMTGHLASLLPAAAFLLAASIGIKLSGLPGSRSIKTVLSTLISLLAPLLAYRLSPDPLAIIPMAAILAMIWTHAGFYRCVLNTRNGAFAMAVVPMLIIFFLGCAASVPLALFSHYQGKRNTRMDSSRTDEVA